MKLTKLMSILLFCVITNIFAIQVVSQKRATTRPASSRTLTRPLAATLISKSSTFVGVHKVSVNVGKFWYDYRDVFDLYTTPIHPLIEKGYVTVGTTGRQSNMWNYEYFTEPTAKGLEEMKTWVKTTRTDASGVWSLAPGSPECTIYEIPVEQKKLIAVTGIANGLLGGMAGVQYTWRWEVTPKGKLLFDKEQSDQVFTATAYFQLYDDGWRVVTLD